MPPQVTLTDPLSRQAQLENLTKVQDGWLGRFTPKTTGKYELKARLRTAGSAGGAGLKGTLLLEDSKQVAVVSDSNTEDYDLRVNDALMKEIAGATNGTVSTMENFSINAMKDSIGKNIRPVIKKQISLSLFPGFYFVIFLLLIIEWVIRRLKGLL